MALIENKQLEKYEAELKSGRVLIFCEDHGYYPDKPLTSLPFAPGCKGCALAFYTYELSKTPPHLREEKAHKMLEMVNHMVEDMESGNFDFEIAGGQVLHKDGDDDGKKIILTD